MMGELLFSPPQKEMEVLILASLAITPDNTCRAKAVDAKMKCAIVTTRQARH